MNKNQEFDVRLLIDGALEKEMSFRRDELYRAELQAKRDASFVECLPDYREDVERCQKAIALWKRVRP